MIDLDYLHDNRSDPAARSVLEDYERSRYDRSSVARLGFAISFANAADDAGADDADDAADDGADDADDADDDAADDADDADDADAAAAAADAAADDAAADDAAADDVATRITHNCFREPDMKEGLKILVLPGGYYGRGVFRVGWLRRVSGDEYELHGARTIIRESVYKIGGFDRLADEGPSGYKLSPAAKGAEDVNRLLIKRSRSADEKAWAKECPKPRDWSDK